MLDSRYLYFFCVVLRTSAAERGEINQIVVSYDYSNLLHSHGLPFVGWFEAPVRALDSGEIEPTLPSPELILFFI